MVRNVKTSVNGSKLTIEVDLANAKSWKPSTSGKTKIVASTGGLVMVDGSKIEDLRINLNVTVPNE
jgi:hypothetical protein